MTEKICAVTATQNRCEVLQRWVAAMRTQHYPLHKMIVVDNGSTDETPQWLAQQTDVQTIRQRNSGSAGGFRTGIKAALATDCDWVWLLDDDVVAAPNALAELVRGMQAQPEARVFNSFCVGIENTQRPSSGALCARTHANDFLRGEYLYTRADIEARADANGLLDSAGGQLYQGTLVHRSVIEKIGAPAPWFFTRGDEVEYALRIMRAGYHIWIVTTSLVMHPDAEIKIMRLGRLRMPMAHMSALKRYYSTRNSIYVRRVYYTNAPIVPYAARRLIGAIVTEWLDGYQRPWREKWQNTLAAARGTWDGMRAAWGDFDPLEQSA